MHIHYICTYIHVYISIYVYKYMYIFAQPIPPRDSFRSSSDTHTYICMYRYMYINICIYSHSLPHLERQFQEFDAAAAGYMYLYTLHTLYIYSIIGVHTLKYLEV